MTTPHPYRLSLLATAVLLTIVPCSEGVAAGLPATLTQDMTLEGRVDVGSNKVVNGQGHSITINKGTYFELNAGQVTNLKDLTVSHPDGSSLINMKTGSTVSLNGHLKADKVYLRDGAAGGNQLSAGSADIKNLQVMAGTTPNQVTVSGLLDVTTFNNAGDVTAGSLTVGSLTNSGTLTVQNNLAFEGASATFTNKGKVYLTNGSLDASNLNFTNQGILATSDEHGKLENLTLNKLVNEKDLTVGTLKTTLDVTNKTGSSLTANTVTVGTSVLNQGTMDVNGALTALSVTNQKDLTVGSLILKGDQTALSNTGTLTIQNNLTVEKAKWLSNSGTINFVGNADFTAQSNGEFNNSGTINVASGIFDAHTLDFRNNGGGKIQKADGQALDSLSVRVLRNNQGTINSDQIVVSGAFYNGEKGAATVTVGSLTAGSILNYGQGTLTVNDTLTLNSLTNRGNATVKDLSLKQLVNEKDLTVNGTVSNLTSLSNSKNSTINLGNSVIFDETVQGTFSNAGTLNVESGKLLISGVEFKNAAGAKLQKSDSSSKIDNLSVKALRNESELVVGVLNSAKFVYNGEAGATSSLTADSIDAIESVLNTNGSTLVVNGLLKTETLGNTGAGVAKIQTVEAQTVNNTEGTLTVTNQLTADWIINEKASLEAKDVEVWRLTNEKGSDLDIENLTMNRNSEGDQAWLQLKSDKVAHIGTLSGESIYAGIDKTSAQTTIDTISDSTGVTFYMPDTEANRVVIGNNLSKNVGVTVDGAVTDTFNPDDLTGAMQKVADTLDIKKGNGIHATAEAGTILGAITATTDSTGKITQIQEAKNSFNVGISELASIAMLAWRAENNDMFKRMGDVRRGDEKNGVWARVMAGESEYGTQSLENDFTTLQFGYDHRVGAANEWILGGAFTYTKGESTFDNGTGDNYQFGLALYGSYLGRNGGYVDVIGKYSRLKNEFDALGGVGKGEYYGNGVSMSVEAGHRFDTISGLYVEPQVEFTYGYLTDVNYSTSVGASVAQDSMKSAVGRVGFNLGKSFEKGNVHAGVSWLKDWEGETSVQMSYKGHTRNFAQDLGDEWVEFEVGGAYDLRDNLKLYGSFETTTGGDVKMPWLANVGIRYVY